MPVLPFRDREPDSSQAAFVAPDAVLVGDVVLGERSSVWFGAVLRADNDRISIGAGTNIQDGCVVHVDRGHPALIGRDVSVGHRAVLHGCTVGDDVLIGMGAIVMNDAVIGTGSIVGAGAVVSAGTDVPPRSLVLGVPGKVRGTVTDEERQATRQNAVDYRALALEFRSAG